MDFLYELLITALLSVLLAFLLGTLFSFSDADASGRVGSGDTSRRTDDELIDTEKKRFGVEGDVAESELEIERVTDTDVVEEEEEGGGGAFESSAEENREVHKFEIRSAMVGTERVDADLLEGEETEAGDVGGGESSTVGAEEMSLGVDATEEFVIERVGDSDVGEPRVEKSRALEKIEIKSDVVEKERIDASFLKEEERLLKIGCDELCKEEYEVRLEEEEADSEIIESLAEEDVLKTKEFVEEVEVESERISEGLVEEKEKLFEEDKSMEVNEIRLVHDSAEEMCHGDSDLFTEGKQLLKEEERSKQLSHVESEMIEGKGVVKASEITEVEGPSKRGSSDKDDGERREKVGPTGDEKMSVVDKEQSFLNEEDEWEGIEKSEVEKLFSKAAAYVGSGSGEDELSRLSSDDQLQLYGLYKVATEGPCYDSQPMALKVSARAKWNAWQKLGNMNPEGAMEQYMNILSEKIPGWTKDKFEGDMKHKESCNLEDRTSGTRIPTSLMLETKPNSGTERTPEGPSCSEKENESDASEYLGQGVPQAN
ncbi:acyl-CoA-binding domain-containing protein 3-like [Iris pallida]|uniref:Acyl-CoA-binding domain-containing protein 3-like n=1 Tax=Iris pallida TaxID=29817 RepID=A0AAX6G3B0_IRIPA|nr:acyl-CoA-binding domain-containing protein 3-like [Iris pallida]KAJ6828137.1 acyl-CoA-binding domain-containing protein 3-like [Iris pallida]